MDSPNICPCLFPRSFFAVLADDHLTNIVERWVCERVPAGKCLFRPNSKSRYLYCILEGAVIVKPAVLKTLETDSSITIGPGNFIGFTEALNGTVRTTECRAGPAPEGAVICKLPAKLFRIFREISQSRYNIVVSTTCAPILNCMRTRRRMESVKRFFRDLSLRSFHSLQVLADCRGFLQQRCFLDRNTIYEQHDEATHFYMVFHGRVVLTRAQKPHCAIHLQTGHFFGHQELFGLWGGRTNCLIKARAGGRRSVTAVAAGRVICTVIPREQFLKLFEKHQDFLDRVDSPATCQHCKRQLGTAKSLSKRQPVRIHARLGLKDGYDFSDHGQVAWSRAARAGDYETLRKIGCGSFGNVYLARSQQARTMHAIKIVSKLDLVWCNENVCYQVSEEMQLLRELKHPLVVDVQQTFSDASNLYIVMEHCDGGSLYSFLHNPVAGAGSAMLTDDQVKTVAAFAIDVFSFLHSHHVVYRDSKSENIVIDALGRLRLIDFTLAKQILHKTYTICGTPQYMAPEIVTGSGYDESVDMWALGVMMYEFLAGYNPFEDPVDQDDDDEDQERMSIFRNVVERNVSFPIRRATARFGARDHAINEFVQSLLIKRPHSRPAAASMRTCKLIADMSVSKLREGVWPNADIAANPFLRPMAVHSKGDIKELGGCITNAHPDTESYTRTGESFEDLWDEVFPPLLPRASTAPRYSWGDERKSCSHTATSLDIRAKTDPKRLGPLKVASGAKVGVVVPSLLEVDVRSREPLLDTDVGKATLTRSPKSPHQSTLDQRQVLRGATPALPPSTRRSSQELRPLWEQERKSLA